MKYSLHLSSGKRSLTIENGLTFGMAIEIHVYGALSEEPSTVAAFYGRLRLRDYITFLKDTDKGGGCYYPEMNFICGPLVDGGFVLEENQVSIWYFSFNEIIKKQDFHSLNLQLAHKALEAVAWFDLLELGLVDKAWITSIKDWLISKNSY